MKIKNIKNTHLFILRQEEYSMKEIDLATWNRAMHCQIFRNSVQPQYGVTFELDITNFLRRIRERGYSFTFSFVFAVTKCANEIKEFRCRFWEGKPVIYDKINTSFTYLDNDSELFKVVNVEMQDTIEEYVLLAANTVREQKEYFTAPMGNDIYQFSSFPWVSFTHISHTESGKKDNATPMIDWGKYFIRNEKVMLPFSIQVHHSFVDGVHIGKLANLLQEYLDNFE